MKEKKSRRRFLTEILSVIIVITIFSGGLQLFFLKKKISQEVETQATLVAQSILQGIKETSLASESIEYQINLRLIETSKQISKDLKMKSLDQITNEDLHQLVNNYQLAGLTIFTKINDDIIGVKATEPQEIGFSFKKYGPEAAKSAEDLLDNKVPTLSGAYITKNTIVLPISQSSSHKEETRYFKYAYYHDPDTNYFINPYIEADDVYGFTQQVGPNSWIEGMKKSNKTIQEIGVLNLKVIRDPSLEAKLYPPMKKVEFGTAQFLTNQDNELLKSLSDSSEMKTSIQSIDGGTMYKMFQPIGQDRVIYIGLDYAVISKSLYSHTIISIVSILLSFIALFFITTKFFTRLKEADEKINYIAYHDDLTNIPNRRMFKEVLTDSIHKAKIYGHQVAVLYLDIDNFKFINDTFGHTFGDQLLLALSDKIKATLHEHEVVARMGGDEFTIILPSITNNKQLAEAAERVLSIFKQPYEISGQEVYVNSSMGISLYPQDGEEIETLVLKADTAMYYAKEQGKNQHQQYQSHMKNMFSDKAILEKDIRKGIQNEEFFVVYQPQVNIQTGEVIGVESLVRWQHPIRGLVSPLEFIPFAEETGLIVPIGEMVLKKACAQMKAWHDHGYPRMKVSVNLSARQFFRENMVDKITEILEESQLDPSYLDLEITEGTIMRNPESTINSLNALKEIGIKVSLDDFGTGYSSFNHLKRLPIDTIKIDRSFIKDLDKGNKDREIVSTIIALGRSLDLDIVAEGVEIEDHVTALQAMKCQHVQGFYFSKPLTTSEFERMFAGLAETAASFRMN